MVVFVLGGVAAGEAASPKSERSACSGCAERGGEGEGNRLRLRRWATEIVLWSDPSLSISSLTAIAESTKGESCPWIRRAFLTGRRVLLFQFVETGTSSSSTSEPAPRFKYLVAGISTLAAAWSARTVCKILWDMAGIQQVPGSTPRGLAFLRSTFLASQEGAGMTVSRGNHISYERSEETREDIILWHLMSEVHPL